MDCWKPVKIQNKGYSNVIDELNHIHARRNSPYYFLYGDLDSQQEYYELLQQITPEYIYVPCRKCPACLKKRSIEWTGRLVRETEFWFNHGCNVLFCTFTYSNKYIKSAQKNYRKDLAKLFDGLRSKYRRSIRHWCIPELGDEKGRFHIHALLFDPPSELAPDSHFHYSKNGALMGSNKIFKSLWHKGINDVGFLKEVKGAIYMVNYLTKSSEYTLKHNDNLPFKGGIVCSNKLGFLDIDENDIVEQINATRTPMYSIGPFSYAYPYSLIRKYTLPLQQRYLSFFNSLTRYSLGGEWSYNGKRYYGYNDYIKSLHSAVSVTAYAKVLKNESSFDNSTIRENINFDFEDLI